MVKGVWALEDKYDASQISPDWHGWIHYMHDKPGSRGAPVRLSSHYRTPGLSAMPQAWFWHHTAAEASTSPPHPRSHPLLAVKAEFVKPFAQPHTINQTMMRTCYTTPEGITSKNNSEGLPDGFHQPPGALRARVKRGRIGPKYQVIHPHPEALSCKILAVPSPGRAAAVLTCSGG